MKLTKQEAFAVAKEAWNIPRGEYIRQGTTDFNLLNKGDGVYVLYIQPSKSIKQDPLDWIRNFKIKKKTVVIGEVTMKVHTGFYEGYQELMQALLPRIKDLKEITIIGYSLGAGVAPIVNVFFKQRKDIIVNGGALFGAPNSISFLHLKGFLQAKKLCHNLIAFKYGRDIVSGEPSALFGYSKICPQFQIKQDNQKYKNIIDWFKRPFTDHGQYPIILKEK